MADVSSSFGQGDRNEHLDAEALCEEIGPDRREIEWRKDFIDFDREDVATSTEEQSESVTKVERSMARLVDSPE